MSSLSNSTAVIECQGLVKTFEDGKREVQVLKGIDLSIQAGESLSIVGSSGSGKSTLLHLLGGLDEPTSGQVKVMGESLDNMSAKVQGQWRNKHLGFIYQFHHLLAEFTAEENVAMPLLVSGMDKAQALKQAQDMIARVGMEHRLSHKPAELSGGERQRVAIARALVAKPACILADEPTGNLDQENAEKVYQLMLDLNRELKTSLLVVTHDKQLAARADRQMTMVDGVINTL